MDAMRGGGVSCGAGGGALCPAGGAGRASLNATMGSLGWTWVHNRPGGSAGFGSGVAANNLGFRHYDSAAAMDSSTYQTISGRNSWGHDHARSVVPTRCRSLPAVPASATDAWVMSDEKQTEEDQHVYGARLPPGQQEENGEPVHRSHTLGECVTCPGIWPFSISYNVAGLQQGRDNQYAQPKLYTVLHRDYASQRRRNNPDPWNLFFRFRFTDHTESTFDNGSPLGRILPTGREDVARNQVALSAGIAYYHRPRPAVQGGEPPNFLNPFWRATLVSPEGASDDRPADSLERAGFVDHATALRALVREGYRGGGPRGEGY
jgi:hypothetical protein